MEPYPSNAHVNRETPENQTENKTASRSREIPERARVDTPKARVDRVISGDVRRRKKSLSKRFKELYFGSDSRSVWQYVALDVIIPATKDLLADIATQGVERMLFGDDHHYGRRGGRMRGRGISRDYTSYSRYTSPRDDRPPFPLGYNRRELTRQARVNHDFDDIILNTRAEAEEIIDRLFDLIEKYESATVADLYEMLGLTSQYTDDKWGWTDIRGSTVRRIREGYLLDLPRPKPLD